MFVLHYMLDFHDRFIECRASQALLTRLEALSVVVLRSEEGCDRRLTSLLKRDARLGIELRRFTI